MTKLIILPILVLLLIRWLRWLAIWQQKEYRLDRLKLFLTTAEGKQELVRLIPAVSDFSRTGLKRPVMTLRILITAFLSGLILALTVWWALTAESWSLIMVLLVYLITPLLIGLVVLPLELIKAVLVKRELLKARQKIQRHQPLIIGITGSYGKTSTKILLNQLLSQKYSVFTPPLSYNTKYSLAKSINRHYQNQEIVLIEYAAYKLGEIQQLTKYFPPQIAMVTGISSQHLGLFGSWENLLKAKAELVQSLPADGVVFCQAADPQAQRVCQLALGRTVKAYSGPEAVVSLSRAGLDRAGKLYFTWMGKHLQTKLLGQHYLVNIQGAIAVAQHLKVSNHQQAKALVELEPGNNFIQAKTGINQTLVIDDGSTANPSGFRAGLELLSHFQPQQRVLVTGGIIDLGFRSDEVHRDLAQQAKSVADMVIYTSQMGLKQFRQILGAKLISQPAQINQVIQEFNQDTVCLIEGRISLWLYKKILS